MSGLKESKEEKTNSKKTKKRKQPSSLLARELRQKLGEIFNLNLDSSYTKAKCEVRFKYLLSMIGLALKWRAISNSMLQQQLSGLNLDSCSTADHAFLSVEDFKCLASYITEDCIFSLGGRGAIQSEIWSWHQRLNFQPLQDEKIFDRLKKSIEAGQEKASSRKKSSNSPPSSLPTFSTSSTLPFPPFSLPISSSSSSSSSSWSLPAPSNPAEDTFIQGLKYFQLGQWFQALPFLHEASPKYPPADLLLAIIYKSTNPLLEKMDMAEKHLKQWQDNYLRFFGIQNLDQAQKQVTNPVHLTYLGLMYKHGVVVKQSAQEAFLVFQKAAQGDAEGIFELATCYHFGDGIEEDEKESKKHFTSLAQRGHASAQNSLGFIEKRWGNPDQATLWYRKAAVQGHAAAQYHLALYHEGLGTTSDSRQAFEWCLKAALQGMDSAQCKLGQYYRDGVGIEPNHKHAFACWSMAAAQGSIKAYYYLGLCYQEGIGVDASEEQARLWYEKAKVHGDAEAISALDTLSLIISLSSSSSSSSSSSFSSQVPQDPVEGAFEQGWKYFQSEQYVQALPFLLEAAKCQYAPAHLLLAIIYKSENPILQNKSKAQEHTTHWRANHLNFFGLKSVDQALDQVTNPVHLTYLGLMYLYNASTKNSSKAFEFFQKAAQTGNANAEFIFAKYCQERKDLQNNPKLLFEYFDKSARQGHVEAQLYLGNCYLDGIGTGRDLEQAFTWHHKAARQGSSHAQNMVALAYESGWGTKVDLKQAFSWFSCAAIQGHPSAQNKMGDCYRKGYSTECDAQQVLACYSMSASQGSSQGYYSVGFCYDNGIGVNFSKQQKLIWLKKAAAKGNRRAKAALESMKMPSGFPPSSFSSSSSSFTSSFGGSSSSSSSFPLHPSSSFLVPSSQSSTSLQISSSSSSSSSSTSSFSGPSTTSSSSFLATLTSSSFPAFLNLFGTPSNSSSSSPAYTMSSLRISADSKLTPWKFAELEGYENIPPRNLTFPEDKYNPHVSYAHLEAIMEQGCFIRMFSSKGDEPGSRSAGARNEVTLLQNPGINRHQVKDINGANRSIVWDSLQSVWIPRDIDEKKYPRGRDKPDKKVTQKASAAFEISSVASWPFDRGPENRYVVGHVHDPRLVESNDRFNYLENAVTFNGPHLYRGSDAPPRISVYNPQTGQMELRDMPRSYPLSVLRRLRIEQDRDNQTQEQKQGQPIMQACTESLIRRRKQSLVGIRTWINTPQARLMAFDEQYNIRKMLGLYLPMTYWSGKRYDNHEITDEILVKDIRELLKHPSDPYYPVLIGYFLDGHFEPGSKLAKLLLQEIPKEGTPLQFKLLLALLSLNTGGSKLVEGLIDAIEIKQIKPNEWDFILFCLTETNLLSTFVLRGENNPPAEFISGLIHDRNLQKKFVNAFLNRRDTGLVLQELPEFCKKFSDDLGYAEQDLIMDTCVKHSPGQTLGQVICQLPTATIVMWKQADTDSNLLHVLANHFFSSLDDLFDRQWVLGLLVQKNQAGQTPIDLALACNNRNFLAQVLPIWQKEVKEQTRRMSESELQLKQELIAKIEACLKKRESSSSNPRSPGKAGFFSPPPVDGDIKVKREPQEDKSIFLTSAPYFSQIGNKTYCQFLDELNGPENPILVGDDGEPLAPTVKKEPA